MMPVLLRCTSLINIFYIRDLVCRFFQEMGLELDLSYSLALAVSNLYVFGPLKDSPAFLAQVLKNLYTFGFKKLR